MSSSLGPAGAYGRMSGGRAESIIGRMVDLVLAVGLVAALFIVAMVAAGLLWLVRMGRSAHLRATNTMSVLRLRTAAHPLGPNRDVARLRLRLRESMRQSRAVIASPMVADGTAQTSWWAEAGDQLVDAAARLDARLALIEREPEPALREQLLEMLGPRVEQLIIDVAAMRTAAYALTIELEQPGAKIVQGDLRDRIQGLLLAIRELARPA